MTTVTGYNAATMKEVEDEAIVNGSLQVDNLILTKYKGTTVNAGKVRGPKGDTGDPGQVTSAQLDAATDPSIDAGNDVVNGSDGKLFFDHQKLYYNHVPAFADAAARDAAIVSPNVGNFCYMLDSSQFLMYRITGGWRPPFNTPWGNLGTKIEPNAKASVTSAAGATELNTSLRIPVNNYLGARLLSATVQVRMATVSGTPGFAISIYNVASTPTVVMAVYQMSVLGVNGYTVSASVVFPSISGNAIFTPYVQVLNAGEVTFGVGLSTDPMRFSIEDIGPITSAIGT